MAAGAPQAHEQYQRGTTGRDDSLLTDARAQASNLKTRVSPLIDWWTKVQNDGVFGMAAQLAYILLLSIFPILLILLAVAGVILGNLSPDAYNTLQTQISTAIPNSGPFLKGVTEKLSSSAGLLFVIGLVTAIYSGSRLFVTMEGNLDIIYRLRGRDALHKNIMALLMMLLYAVLIPIVALAATLPQAAVGLLGSLGNNPVSAFLINVAGIVIAIFFATLLFLAIYIFVPNRRANPSQVWKGALTAGGLLVIYEIIFPIYEAHLLKPGNYGSVAGFAIAIIVFFYYFGLILLLGAEVNSWALGQRQTLGDIAAMFHAVQAHDSTRGIAGPTAGLPQEDLQHHRGAEAMQDPATALRHFREDHHDDATPPEMLGAVHEPGPGHLTDAERQAIWQSIQDEPRRPDQRKESTSAR